MQLGMIGLGRMGADMVRRLMRGGHDCVVYNRSPAPVAELAGEGAVGATSLEEFVSRLAAPRAVWLMVPAAAVDAAIANIAPLLTPGDILIDGGNSYYVDDIRRAKELASGFPSPTTSVRSTAVRLNSRASCTAAPRCLCACRFSHTHDSRWITDRQISI